MNRMVILVLLAASFGAAACKSGQTGSSPQLSPAPAQSKVLIRSIDAGTLAVDGLLWLVDLHLVAEKSAAKDSLMLSDTTGMNVAVEHMSQITGAGQEKQEAKPPEWKRDPKDFDFMVNVIRDYKEQTKTSFGAPLKIAVQETWKIEKVSDPSVTKTWDLAYMLNGGSEIAAFEKTAAEQTERVVVPARGPVLKEIRDLIEKK